jgi:hypothetical protein
LDIDLLRRQVLHSVQVHDGDHGRALGDSATWQGATACPEIAGLLRPTRSRGYHDNGRSQGAGEVLLPRSQDCTTILPVVSTPALL